MVTDVEGCGESLSLHPYTAVTACQTKRLFSRFFPALKDVSEKLKHLEMESGPLPASHPNRDVNISNQVFRVLLCLPVTQLQTSEKSFPSKAFTFSFLSLGNLSVLNAYKPVLPFTKVKFVDVQEETLASTLRPIRSSQVFFKHSQK